jgi:hypothetical protein
MKEIYPSLFIGVNGDYLLLKLISGAAWISEIEE